MPSLFQRIRPIKRRQIVEKVRYLRRKYHLGPIRIVWYSARYHGIKTSDAGVYRILKRNGLNRLPRGTRMRKLHTKRYQKQVSRCPAVVCLQTMRGGTSYPSGR